MTNILITLLFAITFHCSTSKAYKPRTLVPNKWNPVFEDKGRGASCDTEMEQIKNDQCKIQREVVFQRTRATMTSALGWLTCFGERIDKSASIVIRPFAYENVLDTSPQPLQTHISVQIKSNSDFYISSIQSFVSSTQEEFYTIHDYNQKFSYAFNIAREGSKNSSEFVLSSKVQKGDQFEWVEIERIPMSCTYVYGTATIRTYTDY